MDEKQRYAIIHEMQAVDFERGGYIITSCNQNIDLTSKTVQGFDPGASDYALGNFDWASAWLS